MHGIVHFHCLCCFKFAKLHASIILYQWNPESQPSQYLRVFFLDLIKYKGAIAKKKKKCANKGQIALEGMFEIKKSTCQNTSI